MLVSPDAGEAEAGRDTTPNVRCSAWYADELRCVHAPWFSGSSWTHSSSASPYGAIASRSASPFSG